MTSALGLYGEALTSGSAPICATQLRFQDGSVMALPLGRYTSPADRTDEMVLDLARGPVLDVGCGPGRHLHALARRGVFALGVDLSPQAVCLARGGGGHALLRSVFDELPGAGKWRCALLLDGNIGIGGHPDRLLRRVRTLLAERGEAIVELDSPSRAGMRALARLETPQATSEWFAWARVSADQIEALAAQSGFQVRSRHAQDGRWFARLLGVQAAGC